MGHDPVHTRRDRGGEGDRQHARPQDFPRDAPPTAGSGLVTYIVGRSSHNEKGVQNFGAHIGRAEAADEVVGANFIEVWISLDRNVDYDATVARVEKIVDGDPGLSRDLLTYLRERIKEVLTGAAATVVVRIFGPDRIRCARYGERRVTRG